MAIGVQFDIELPLPFQPGVPESCRRYLHGERRQHFPGIADEQQVGGFGEKTVVQLDQIGRNIEPPFLARYQIKAKEKKIKFVDYPSMRLIDP